MSFRLCELFAEKRQSLGRTAGFGQLRRGLNGVVVFCIPILRFIQRSIGLRRLDASLPLTLVRERLSVAAMDLQQQAEFVVKPTLIFQQLPV